MKRAWTDEVLRRVDGLPSGPPPPPWRLALDRPRSGLLALGFQDGADLLLLLGTDRREAIDCLAGVLLAVEEHEAWGDWWHAPDLLCAGVGPMAAVRVRMAGAFGGGLRLDTDDGWSVEAIHVTWNSPMIVLQPPGTGLFLDAPRRRGCVRLDWKPVDTPRAWGFSPTGRTLVLADADHTQIFIR